MYKIDNLNVINICKIDRDKEPQEIGARLTIERII